MPNERTSVLRTWFEEVWNKAREEAIDELAAEGVVAHGLFDAQGQEISGREKFKAFWRQFRTTFPDVRIEVSDVLVDGEKEVARCTVRAKHSGEGMGTPSHKAISFSGMVMARVGDGQLQEVWDSWDFLGLYQQMGMVPALAPK